MSIIGKEPLAILTREDAESLKCEISFILRTPGARVGFQITDDGKIHAYFVGKNGASSGWGAVVEVVRGR